MLESERVKLEEALGEIEQCIEDQEIDNLEARNAVVRFKKLLESYGEREDRGAMLAAEIGIGEETRATLMAALVKGMMRGASKRDVRDVRGDFD